MRILGRTSLSVLTAATLGAGLWIGLTPVNATDPAGTNCGTPLVRGTGSVVNALCDTAVYEPQRWIALGLIALAALLLLVLVVAVVRGRRKRSAATPPEEADAPATRTFDLDGENELAQLALRTGRADADPDVDSTADAADDDAAPGDPVATAIMAAKHDLSAGRRPIATHDLLEEEVVRLAELDVFSDDPVVFTGYRYADRLPTIESETRLWAALCATLAYWGDAHTDRWWLRHLPRFGDARRLTGSTDAVRSLASPAVIALYAGGTAAVAAERWDLVAALLNGTEVRPPNDMDRQPAATTIGPDNVYPTSPWPSRDLARLLTPVLAYEVGLGQQTVADAWERFEYLVCVVTAYRLQHNRPCLVPVTSPYVQVEQDLSDSKRPLRPIPGEYFRSGNSPVIRALLRQGMFDGDPAKATAAITAADQMICDHVVRTEMAVMTAGVFGSGGTRYALVPDQRP